MDQDRHYHLFGTLVSKDEKTEDFEFAFTTIKKSVRELFSYEMKPKILISGAAGTIHNAAKAVFVTRIHILMCWFHMKKGVKNIGQFVKNIQSQKEILSDLGNEERNGTERNGTGRVVTGRVEDCYSMSPIQEG